MPNYRVSWEIDIEAESSRKAAEEALEIQRDPFSTATVFFVRESNCEKIETIDLEAAEN